MAPGHVLPRPGEGVCTTPGVVPTGGVTGGFKLNLNVKMENPKIRPPPPTNAYFIDSLFVNMLIKVKGGGGGGG